MKKLFQTLALASLAIAGMIVSSCEVENITTTFEPSAAVAKVTVKVFDVADNGKDVTDQATITTDINSANVTVSGNVVTVTGTPAIAKTTFNVIANVPGNEPKSTSVTVEALLAGGEANYSASINVGVIPGSEEYELVPGEEKTTSKKGTFFSTHGHETYTHSYSHATYGHGEGDGEWLYNESEFILTTTVTYDSFTGIMLDKCVKEYTAEAKASDKPMVDKFFESLTLNAGTTVKETIDVKVSAFAMYSAYGIQYFKTRSYSVNRKNVDGSKTQVGKFEIVKVDTAAQYCEAAMPGHSGHYHYGHGHDDVHGYSSNAGGGIMWAE